MSVELENTTKSIDVIRKERTWRVEMFCDRNSEYQFVIHREISETQDGEFLPVDRESVEIPRYQVGVNSVLASEENVTYTGLDGNTRTIPAKDLPLLVSKFCDDEIARAKASGYQVQE